MEPFNFYTRISQIELLGRSARNIPELLEAIREVPASSIYHHTHRYLEQHRYFSPGYPNDFSYWITNYLELRALGEKIVSIDIMQFHDIESLRQSFIEILEDYLYKEPEVRNCLEGEEFQFLSSKNFILPTHFVADDLKSFIDCLKKVTVHSLYFHMFEARLRLGLPDNDFSSWLRDGGFTELADRISKIDPYTYTMEGLRNRIISFIQGEIS